MEAKQAGAPNYLSDVLNRRRQADAQSQTDESGNTRPYKLMNTFGSMQSEMRPQGVGLGPNGNMSRPQFTSTDDYVNQLKMMGGPPGGGYSNFGAPAQVQATPQTGLVNFQGRQIDASVLRYANDIARMFPQLRFSSGYRDPAHNQRVNGSPTSWHLKGRALDWSGPAQYMQAAKQWALQNGAREAMIHNAGSGTHLHVAW